MSECPEKWFVVLVTLALLGLASTLAFWARRDIRYTPIGDGNKWTRKIDAFMSGLLLASSSVVVIGIAIILVWVCLFYEKNC